MNDVKLNVLVVICCLIAVSLGCRNGNFPPPPNNGVVKLDKLGEAPKSKDDNHRSDDQVAVIDNDGKLSLDEVIDETCGELVLARNSKEWEPAGQPSMNPSYDKQNVERTVPKGYKFKYGSDRRPYYKWFPPEQVFSAPWANNVNLKIGDTVYINVSSPAFVEKGVISEVPVKRFGNFRVRFGDKADSREVAPRLLYTSIEPAKAENLSPGDFVYYNSTNWTAVHWAMVIGKQDDKIIIRQASSSSSSKPEDIIVDISELKILK